MHRQIQNLPARLEIQRREEREEKRDLAKIKGRSPSGRRNSLISPHNFE